MPDHLRQPHKNAMGPRSPAGSDSPLSLVIGRSRDHHSPHDHIIHNKTPPPPPFEPHHNQGSSSGFSEGDSPQDSPERPHGEQDVELEQPLSLVVPKNNKIYDSGHDEDSSSPRPLSMTNAEDLLATKDTNGLKIKDFAKYNLGEDAREKIPQHSEHALLAALTAPPKSKIAVVSERGAAGPPPPPSSSAGCELEKNLVIGASANVTDIDAMSEVSSMSSMSDLIQAQRIGDHTVYPCDFCDKVFANKYHLASHLVTHTGERSFECKFCQKTFGRRSTLRAHMTTHTKTSNFMCPLCEKACNDNNSLEEHIRMHTGEKPFVCTICAKAYARKSHLNVHYRVHTGERPFVCMSCGKDFTEKRFLNDHMQTAHSGNDGPLKCPNCFREFAYKTSLKQHLKKQMCAKNLNRGQPNSSNINNTNGSGSQNSNSTGSNGGSNNNPSHVHAKQFACPFCEKSYSWKQTLKQHVSMYHRNKVHTDEFWKYELAKHRRTVLDSKTNEDMWKKQLGKHADEIPLLGGVGHHRHPSFDFTENKSVVDVKSSPDRWLEQIKMSTSTDSNQNKQVSTEMKLLALQSLQNSLQMMNNNNNNCGIATSKSISPPKSICSASEVTAAGIMSRPQTPPSSVSPPSVVGTGVAALAAAAPPPPPPPSSGTTPNGVPTIQAQTQQPQSGYLNLLAHLSAQRKAESDLELAAAIEQQRRPSLKNNSAHEATTATLITSAGLSPPPYLPDIKEESATKRTQMWLAQLGRYRQKSFQDEMDRNHDELWEEQIAKVKQCPVRSPIEPIEITLDQDENSTAENNNTNENAAAAEEVRGGLKPKLEDSSSTNPANLPAPPTTAAAVAVTTPARKLANFKEFQGISSRNQGMIPLMMSALECYPPPRRPSSPPPAATGKSENNNIISNLITTRPATPVSPSPRASPMPRPVGPHHHPIRNVISIKTSAISRVENHPRTFSLNLEINNNNPISDDGADHHEEQSQHHREHQQNQPRINRHIPVPVIPTSRGLAENPPPMKRRLLEIPEDDLASPPAVVVHAGTTEQHNELLPSAVGQDDLEVKVNSPAGLASAASKTDGATAAAVVPVTKVEDSSVLKSLLMDRLPRKRSLSPAIKATITNPSKKRPSITNGDSDILRKRLLGLKTENPAPDVVLAGGAAMAIKPRFQPPSATITSEQQQHQVASVQQHLVHHHHRDGPPPPSSNPVDLTKVEGHQLLHHHALPNGHAGQLDNNNLNNNNVNVMNGAEFEPGVIQQRSAHHPSIVNKQLIQQVQQPAPPAKSYTQTSVLKHLLYRYTNSEVDEVQQH